MQVETYEQIELTTDGLEDRGAAQALIEELDLAGQQSLDGNTYREMTAEEVTIARALFPVGIEAYKYDRDPIPTRVLETLKHATGLNVFRKFEVWCAPSMADKDPLLVAYIGENDWSAKKYLLARWGDALESWATLRTKAMKSLASQRLAKLMAIRASVQCELDMAKDYPEQFNVRALAEDIPSYYSNL